MVYESSIYMNVCPNGKIFMNAVQSKDREIPCGGKSRKIICTSFVDESSMGLVPRV